MDRFCQQEIIRKYTIDTVAILSGSKTATDYKTNCCLLTEMIANKTDYEPLTWGWEYIDWSSWKMLKAFVWNIIKSTSLSCHNVLLFLTGCHLQIRAQLGLSTSRSRFSSQRSRDVTIGNLVGFLVRLICYFCRVTNSDWCIWSIPFHGRFRNRPQRLRCDFTVPYFCFPPFECLSTGHWSMVLATQLLGTAVLYAGTRVTCHSCLNLFLCFSRLSRPGISLLRSESVSSLVDNLYA
jgi:hypothetical protein